MPDVFISYKRSDFNQIRPIAEALKAKGLSVWCDADLEPGPAFDAEIAKALRDAKAVLVCWSKESCDSAWVLDEARKGREQQKLVSVLLEPCTPKAPFEALRNEDLSDWRGEDAHVGWRRLVASIGERAGRGDLAGAQTEKRKTPVAAIVAAALTLAALVGGGAYVLSRGAPPAAPEAVSTAK